MTTSVHLLIRKTLFHERGHPTTQLVSYITITIDRMDSPICSIHIDKGYGRSAALQRTEHAFVKFLLVNFGPGKYTVLRVKGKFKSFFNGVVEQDRWVRYKGVISPFLKASQPRQWHILTFNTVQQE